MPLSPIDVLKRLQTNPAAELPDVDANDPATLYGMLDRNATELSHNLVNNTPAIQPEETAYGPKGPIGQGFGNRENHGMPTFTSGGNVADLKSFLDDMKSSPVETERPGLAATAEANRVAQTQGFTGGRNIALDRSDPHAPAGEISAAMSVPSAPPAAQAAGNQRQMDLTKLLSPLAVEQEKNKGLMDVQNLQQRQAMALQGMNPDGSPLAGRTAAGGTTPPGGGPANPPAPTPPVGHSGLQGMMDFATGKGPVPYNGFTDMMKAGADRILASHAATPMTPIVQENAFANLSQLSGMFPGVRGFGYLLPKLAEFQASYGKGETPASTFARLDGLDHMINDSEQALNDPSERMKMATNGKITMAQIPQTILRAKMALDETKKTLAQMRANLQDRYPGIGGGPAAGPKMVMGPDGNLVPKGQVQQ